jgi:predicted kinase
VAKDDVKEAIADVLGTGDKVHSRQLGAAAFTAMRNVAARSLEMEASVVLEGNFTRERSETWLRELTGVAEARVVICRTPKDRERFAARAGRRHSIHVDDIAEEWPPTEAFAIDLGVPTLVVDTTDGYKPDLETIMRFIA